VSSMSITSRVFKLKMLLLSFGEPSQLYINQYNYNPTATLPFTEARR